MCNLWYWALQNKLNDGNRCYIRCDICNLQYPGDEYADYRELKLLLSVVRRQFFLHNLIFNHFPDFRHMWKTKGVLRMCCRCPRSSGGARSTGTGPAHEPAACSLPAAGSTEHTVHMQADRTRHIQRVPNVRRAGRRHDDSLLYTQTENTEWWPFNTEMHTRVFALMYQSDNIHSMRYWPRGFVWRLWPRRPLSRCNIYQTEGHEVIYTPAW